MDDEKFDLNLMRVLDALMEDGNLTRAGYRLGLSQPAMSHALARLRKLTGDTLFVRVPTGMEPSEMALRMAPAVREGLRLLEGALEGDVAFDPLTCERTFQVLMSDIGELVYLPRLIRRLQELAPRMNVRALQLPREAYQGPSSVAKQTWPSASCRDCRPASISSGCFQTRMSASSGRTTPASKAASHWRSSWPNRKSRSSREDRATAL